MTTEQEFLGRRADEGWSIEYGDKLITDEWRTGSERRRDGRATAARQTSTGSWRTSTAATRAITGTRRQKAGSWLELSGSQQRRDGSLTQGSIRGYTQVYAVYLPPLIYVGVYSVG